jgi:hypothetical protein
VHDVAPRLQVDRPAPMNAAVVTAALLLAPALSLLLLRSSISTAGADPSFYLGYVLDLTTHIERFGQTYHGNRISYLFVDIPFFAVLPPRSAFYAARYAMLLVAAIAVFRIGRRFGGDTVGLLSVATVLFVPWLPRQLLWMHYDGFATVYLLVALAFLLVPVAPAPRRIGEVLAGAAVALAVNANLVLLAVVALFLPSWWLLRPEDGSALRLRAALRIGAGFLAVSALIAAVLHRLYPDGEAFPELVALRVGLDVLASDTWFVPLRSLGRSLGYLVVVPLVAAVLAAALLRARSERRLGGGGRDSDGGGPQGAATGWDLLARAALLHLVLMAALALVLHFRFENTWLSASYYTIYHLPGVLLGVVALLSWWWERAATPHRTRFALAGVLVLVSFYAALPLPSAFAVPAVAIAVIAGLGALASVRSVGARGTRWLPVMVALLSVGFAASPWHAGRSGTSEDVREREHLEWDVFDHSVALKRLVEDLTDTDDRVVFWHTNRGAEGDWLTRLNMVFYGTGEGRLHWKSNPDGMPVLTEGERTTIRDERPLVVVLLAADAAALDAGKVELLLSGGDVSQLHGSVLTGDVIDVHVAVMELR